MKKTTIIFCACAMMLCGLPALAAEPIYQEILQGKTKSSCPARFIGSRTVEGKYLGWQQPETGMPFVSIQVRGHKEPFFMAAMEEDAKKYFGEATGKPVSATYNIDQEWLEEEKICARIKMLVSGKALGGRK